MKALPKFPVVFFTLVSLILLAMFATMELQAECTPPPTGLVGWWPGQGTADDVGGVDNGLLQGGATFVPGKVGLGFRLDGTNGYVQIPDSVALKPTNLTVEAWIWLDPNLSTNRGGEQIVFKKNTSTAWFEGYSLLKCTIDNGNGTYADHFQFCVSRAGNQVPINSQTIAQRGVWYHVAATYDGNQSKLYVNGVLEASATPGFALDYDTTPLFIGTSGTWAPYLAMFGGIIDEPSIYNRVLLTSEIQAIFNSGNAGKCGPDGQTNVCVTPPAGLVGWWKGDGTAMDVVATNNGVVVNAGYTNGLVGQAFAFDPENLPFFTYTGVEIADQPAYALTNSLTIEGWVRPRGDGYVIFWRGDNRPGFDPYSISMNANNLLGFNICDADGNYASVTTPLNYFVWTHVGATLDGASGTMSLYTNGVLAVQTNTTIRPFANLTGASPGIGIGNVNDGGNVFPFIGDIDEISLYNRAITAGEIQAIYNAGSSGKCSEAIVAPVVLVDASTAGYYNDSLGTVLDGSTPQFPLPYGTGADSTIYPAVEPPLTPASAILGNWLAPGTALNANWLWLTSIPSTWALNTETAIIYEVNGGTNGFSNLQGDFDVDNGIYIWVNGQYKFGARAPGLPSPTGQFEYTNVNLGSLSPGTNRIQIIREDSGISTGYQIRISGKPVVGAPQPDAPLITMQPTNQTVSAGDTTVFSVAVSGAQPLSYQWNFNGTNVGGGTGPTLILTNLQSFQAGNYAVVVTNLYGSATSSTVTLTVVVPAIPPSVLSQTPNQIVLLGNTAIFSVNAGGSDPLSYFWQRNNVPIPGATNSSYALINAQLSDSGSKFNCVVTNAYGSASSTNVTLKVIDSIYNDLCSGAVVITNASYTNNQSTLKATAFGDPVPDCVDGFGHGVWYQFTAPVAGRLTVDTFGSDFDTGLAVYTGACDGLTQVACNDDTGGVNSQIVIPTTAGAAYYILAGGYGSDAGNLVLHLLHQTPPAFVIQSGNQAAVVGSNATFTVTLDGTAPLVYQWLLNGNPLSDNAHFSGSTTPSLTISNVTSADAAVSYSVTVTNFLGSVTSTAANLSVLSITTQPVGRSVPPGLPTTFTAAASANPMPAYQWQLNGTNIPGATGASCTIPAVGTNHLGFYHLVATYPVGVVVSQDAQLTFGPVAAWGRNLSGECLPPPGLTNVFAVAGTFGASFAARTDGSIVAWGSGVVTNIPASASNVVAIAANGGNLNYALRSDGRVVSWAGLSAPPVSNIVSIAAGNGFAYALRAEGTLTNWGSVPWGSNPALNFPSGLNHLTAIAAGSVNAIALKNDGTISVAGIGAVTNIPAGLTNVIAIAVGDTYAMALKADGKVVAWGSGAATNLPAGMTNIVAISAGNYPKENFGLAIRSNGRVVVWGDNSNAELNSPNALTNLVSIAGAAAAYHGLALVNDGSPVILQQPVGLTAFSGRDVILRSSAAGAQPLSYQWLFNGLNIPGATNASLFLPNVQSVDAGGYQLFVSNSVNTALSVAAPLTIVSNNAITFLGVPSGQTNYQGGRTVLSATVLGNGPLRYQWFFSPTNQGYAAVPGATNDTLVLEPALAMNTGNYYLAASNQFAGMTSSPAFVRILFARAWGYQAISNPPVNVTNAIALAMSYNANFANTYFALGANGKLTAWTSILSSSETNLAALSNSFITAIAAGQQHELVLKSDGTVYGWGSGLAQTNIPPSGLNNVIGIACGAYHDLALKSDGTVVGWGAGSGSFFNYGQAASNPDATNVVAIAAAQYRTMALRANGTVVIWGNTGDGTGVIPSSATNIIAIAGGTAFNAALRADGKVVQWGSGMTSYPVPSNLSNVVAISASSQHCTALKNDGTVVSWGFEFQTPASNNVPADLANVIAITSNGEQDMALFGNRAPAFTIQPWNRSVPVNATTNILLAAKCAGVQPVSYQWQLNGTNVPGATNDVLILTNRISAPQVPNIRMATGAYQLIASNAYGVVASKYAKVTTFYPLGEALDTTVTEGRNTNSIYNWITTGSAQWFGETNITHDGVDAAQSGGIGALQESILQTTVGTNWSGRYTFWWKVSSEPDFDFLEFRLNGTTLASISGETGWQLFSLPVATGTNVLQWRYSKDVSFDSGQDAGWVDQFAFLPDPPLITSQPTNQVANMGENVLFRVTAIGPLYAPQGGTGTPTLRYVWRQNGNIVGGNSPTLTLNTVGRGQNGIYSVTVTNFSIANNFIVSSNAVLKVLVPQLLGTPTMMPDGSFQLTSTDANGGLLQPSDLANFEAQASTNLLDWVTLPNALSLTNGTLLLQDGAQTNNPTRFYRLVEH